MVRRTDVELALRAERNEQIWHGHDWDVSDVMKVLDEKVDWENE